MIAALALSSLVAQSDTPEKFASPDGKYFVQIVQKAMPGTNSLDEFTLVMMANRRTLVKAPTFGYLIAAHWSPDGKYVAIITDVAMPEIMSGCSIFSPGRR